MNADLDYDRAAAALTLLDRATEQARDLIRSLSEASDLLASEEDGAPLDPLAVHVSAVGASLAVHMNALTLAVKAEREGL